MATCSAAELRQQLQRLPVAAALQLSVTARQLKSQDQSLLLALGSDDLLEVRLPELSEAALYCMSVSLQCCCISQPQARPPSPLCLSLMAAGCCAGLGAAADWPPDATPSSRLGFRWADSCLDPTGKPLLHLGLAALQHCHEPCSLWHLLLVPCALHHLPSHRSLA